MSITLNNTNIKSIFYNGTALKSLYLNGIKVWSSSSLIKIKPMRELYPDTYQTVLSLSFPSDKFDINIDNYASQRMFGYCHSLTSLDLSNFNTSNVTDMSGMFYDCLSLASLDLSSFDTGNVTDMGGMFYDCSKLTSLDLSNFNTSKVTNMSSTFGYCHSLTSLDLSNFDTSKVQRLSSMFNGCESLTSLDLSSFDTSQAGSFDFMFYGCKNLTEIKGIIDLKSVEQMAWNRSTPGWNGMFEDCSKLNGIKIKNPPANFFEEITVRDVTKYGYEHAGLRRDQFEIVK